MNIKAKVMWLIVGILFIVAIFFRLWHLNSVPISLFGDEIDVGLQAFSIATTGKDYLGNKIPIMFHSFNEYRLPMQLYLDVPFIKIFGQNELGVRMPAVIAGFSSLILFYFLIKELFDKKLAILASFFLIISPWHFNFSRQANDAGILLPFILGGVLFFVKGLKDYKYLIFSSVLFAFSIYTYAIAIAFVPLFIIFAVVIYRNDFFKIPFLKIIYAVVVGLLILVPYINFTLKGVTSERFTTISAFSENKVMGEVVDKRRWSNSFLTRLLYNRKTVVAEIFGKNYLKSFSTGFLFTEGDPNMRQSVEGFGQMYHFDLILIVLGICLFFYSSFREKYNKSYLIILSWLILAPIPSAMTVDGGTHASRLILMLVPLILIASSGFMVLLKSAKNNKQKVVFALFLCFMFFDITRFFHRYFVIWPNESWRFWQFGYKDMLKYVKTQDTSYKEIVFNNTYEPMLPRFLFYYQYDMSLFQKQFTGDISRDNIIPGVNGFSLDDKYYFGDLKKPIEKLANRETLVVASAEKDATNPDIFKMSPLKLMFQNSSPTNIPIFYVFTSN